MLDCEVGAVPVKRYATLLNDVILSKLKLRSLAAKVTVPGSMLKVVMGYLYVYNNSDFAKLKDACIWSCITDVPSELGTFLPLLPAGKYEPELMPILGEARFGEMAVETLRDGVGAEVAARFLAERESGHMSEFGGPYLDKVVTDMSSKVQRVLTPVVDCFFRTRASTTRWP